MIDTPEARASYFADLGRIKEEALWNSAYGDAITQKAVPFVDLRQVRRCAMWTSAGNIPAFVLLSDAQVRWRSRAIGHPEVQLIVEEYASQEVEPLQTRFDLDFKRKTIAVHKGPKPQDELDVNILGHIKNRIKTSRNDRIESKIGLSIPNTEDIERLMEEMLRGASGEFARHINGSAL